MTKDFILGMAFGWSVGTVGLIGGYAMVQRKLLCKVVDMRIKKLIDSVRQQRIRMVG